MNHFLLRHRKIMKPTFSTLLLCLALATPGFGATAPDSTDLAAVIVRAATYQSGESKEALRQIEALVREALAKPALCQSLEAELHKLLVPAATLEARSFACQQLAVIGSERSLPALAELLKRPEDTSFACLALTTYPPGKADNVLRDALPGSRGIARVQIINTLGDRRDSKAVAALTAIVNENESASTRAAIISLAKIGDAAARKALATLRSTAAPELERWFTEADLRLAGQLAKSGDRKAAAAIYESLIGSQHPASVRRGAFAALLRLEKDGGAARILQTLRGSDSMLRPVAIGAVRSLPSKGASEKFARELPGLAPEEQVWLVDSLAARNDPSARATLIASLSSTHAVVRRAAAGALGRVGGAAAVKPFAKAIAAASDADEARALESALGGLPADRATDQAVFAEIKAGQGSTRAHLIAALATRPGPQVTTLLLEETEHSDAVVAKAAYRVLARAGADDSLPLLLRKFAALRNAALRGEVEGFVEQAVGATEDASRRSAAVREALGQTRDVESRCSLLRLLPACGDAPALNALNAALTDVDASVRDAAVRALAEWPDLSAWLPLSAVWAKPASDAQRALALQGLVRLADEANANPDEKLLARYRELIAGARNDEELKKVLSALGGVAHPEALPLALPLLEKPAVRAEAEATVKRIAAAIKAKHPEAAQAALDRVAGK